MTTSVAWLFLLIGVSHVIGSDVMKRDAMTRLTNAATLLSHKVDHLTTRVTSLKASLAVKQVTIDSLTARLHADQQAIANLTSQLSAETRQATAVTSYCNNTWNSLSPRLLTMEHPEVFYVRYGNDSAGNLTTHVRSGDKLMFDVIMAGGDNYNSSTGYFTAPSRGTYVFFLTTQRSNPLTDQCLQVSLIKNDRPWLLACTAAACPPGYSSSSVTCVNHLQQGDTIHAAANHVEGVLGYLHTTVAGFMINPM